MCRQTAFTGGKASSLAFMTQNLEDICASHPGMEVKGVKNFFDVLTNEPIPDVKVPKGICVTSVGCKDLYSHAADCLDEVRKAANSWKGTDSERRENLEEACNT